MAQNESPSATLNLFQDRPKFNTAGFNLYAKVHIQWACSQLRLFMDNMMFNFKPHSFKEKRAGPEWIWMGDSQQCWHAARNIWLQTDIPERCSGMGTRCPCPPLSGLPSPGLWEPSCPFHSPWAQLVSANPNNSNWKSPGRRRGEILQEVRIAASAPAVQTDHKPHLGIFHSSEPCSWRPSKPCHWQALYPKLSFSCRY